MYACLLHVGDIHLLHHTGCARLGVRSVHSTSDMKLEIATFTKRLLHLRSIVWPRSFLARVPAPAGAPQISQCSLRYLLLQTNKGCTVRQNSVGQFFSFVSILLFLLLSRYCLYPCCTQHTLLSRLPFLATWPTKKSNKNDIESP